MSVFLVSYDLKNDQAREVLRGKLLNNFDSVYISDSAYAIDSSHSQEKIFEHLNEGITEKDELLIIRVSGPPTGWLSEEAWEWLNKRL